MANNINGSAYALTILSPIKDGYTSDEVAYADVVRDRLQEWNFEYNSPMAKVPQIYFCRFFVLDDVVTQSLPGAGVLDVFTDISPILTDSMRRGTLPKVDHLKSRYLVFSCEFHGGPKGDLEGYLRGMWNAIGDRIKEVWGYCYGFETVNNADQFIKYMKKCQLSASLFFIGSNDESVEEQLKALYLKQEFAKFVVENQGLNPSTLRVNFQTFLQRVAPANLAAPTWPAGKYRI